jgi:hypothetical protein
MTSLLRLGQVLCLVALYVVVLLVIAIRASDYCSGAPESQGAWVFVTLFSPVLWLVPLGGLVLLVLRPKGFAARCGMTIGISCAQVRSTSFAFSRGARHRTMSDNPIGDP